MTREEKIAYLKIVCPAPDGESYDDETLGAYLTMAQEIAERKVYPFADPDEDVMHKYDSVICEIATYLANKRGAEGEEVHNENGTDRTYESAGVPDSILKKLIPFCGVVG